MDKRDIENMLYAYPYLLAENRNIELEMERLEVVGFKNITYDFKPKSSQTSSIVENEVIGRDVEIQKLKDRLSTNITTIKKIENSLEVLTEYEKAIITKIYFKRYRNNEIAQQLFLTHVYISRLKKSALRKLMGLLK